MIDLLPRPAVRPACLGGVRGRVEAGAALAPFTWFRVGGPAEFLVKPADAADVVTLLAALPADMPLNVIGAASNLIIRDGGIPGVVLRLARGFADISVEPDGIVAGAAALDMTVAAHAAAAGRVGLEFLSGIPGSIGGAVAMNAGAYGDEVCDVLDWAEFATRDGVVRLPAGELHLAYRHAELPPRSVILRARFWTRPGDAAPRMAAIRAAREAAQPTRARTGGSTFRNPSNAPGGHKAWALIDAAGGRGLTRGAAQVSEKHCNFLLNLGGATAADIEGLGEDVRTRVLAHSGIELRWEIARLGVGV